MDYNDVETRRWGSEPRAIPMEGHTMEHRTLRRRWIPGLVAIALPLATVGTIVAVSGSPAGASGTPVVSAVSPTFGPVAGGTPVTITGSGFTGATVVDFNGTAATSVHVVSDTQITATSPALATAIVGDTVDVTVTSGTTSAPGVNDEFTYTYNTTTTPSVGSVSITSPSNASMIVAPNTVVTLTGTSGQILSGTPYGLSLIDVTTASNPSDLAHTGSGTTVTPTLEPQHVSGTYRYVAELDYCNTPSCPPNSLALTNGSSTQ